MRLVVPDCSAMAQRGGLLARQEREIVRILAEEGPEGLETWLRKEEQRDPAIRARVEALRQRLERDARARRRAMQEQHAGEVEGARSSWERRMQDHVERERALQERIAQTEAPVQWTRESLLGPAVPPARRSSLLGALRRFWIFLVSLWVRFVRMLRGKRAPEPRTVIALPEGLVDLAGLGPDMVMSLSKAQSTWRQRLRDRLLGREDHAEAARRRLQEQAEAKAERLRKEREAERARLRRELEEMKKREDREREDQEREKQDMRTRHHRDIAQVDQEVETAPYERLRQELLADLHEAGLVDEEGHVTRGLMERFSSLLYEEARRAIPGGGHATPGTYVEGEGEYELGPLRSRHELGAMDLAQSVVQARIRHPRVRHLFDEDVMVHREVRTEKSHMVIVFDASGSMEEQGRLEAAKRICLVLWRAVRDRNPDHRVDLLRMETHVEAVDLAACWETKPGGFTNHGAAFRKAARLFEHEGADRKTLYVVTDGLPEAWTDEQGVDHADRVDVCMPYARQQARHLREITNLHTVILQLETREPQFVEAARQLADEAGGRLEALDPTQLMAWMVADHDSAVGRLPHRA